MDKFTEQAQHFCKEEAQITNKVYAKNVQHLSSLENHKSNYVEIPSQFSQNDGHQEYK